MNLPLCLAQSSRGHRLAISNRGGVKLVMVFGFPAIYYIFYCVEYTLNGKLKFQTQFFFKSLKSYLTKTEGVYVERQYRIVWDSDCNAMFKKGQINFGQRAYLRSRRVKKRVRYYTFWHSRKRQVFESAALFSAPFAITLRVFTSTLRHFSVSMFVGYIQLY